MAKYRISGFMKTIFYSDFDADNHQDAWDQALRLPPPINPCDDSSVDWVRMPHDPRIEFEPWEIEELPVYPDEEKPEDQPVKVQHNHNQGKRK